MVVQYLGFCVGKGCIWAVPNKVAALRNASPPRTKKELQQFLGIANYYHRFVPQFAMLVAALMDLLQGRGNGTAGDLDREIPGHLSEPQKRPYVLILS